MNFNNVKYVNLSVQLNGCCADITEDFIKELDLEYGSTYSFLVSNGLPLSFQGIPYKPLKLTMEDKEGPIIIKSPIFYMRNLPLSYKSNGMTTIGWKKGKVVKYERILHTCIWGLVSKSDIIKGIIENRHYRASDNPSFIVPNVTGHDVINMTLACSKITKGDFVNEKSNIILLN